MEQEFPSFLMESYVQEKLLICTWKHTGFAFCFSTNTVLVYIRNISGNKGVIPRVYYKSCGASTSQSDSYSHKCSITWIFVQIFLPCSSHFQASQTSPNQRSRVPVAQLCSPAGFWEELCPAWCPSPAHPRISALGLGGWPRLGAALWLWEVWCFICQDLVTVVWKGFIKSWVWQSWIKTNFDKL